MKFSIALVVLAICALGSAQSPPAGLGAIGPPSFCEIHLAILQSQANKIDTPDLDEDLKTRITAVLDNAAQGCSNCDDTIIWLNKVCLVMNLRTGLIQLSQIKTEADARATAAATPVTSA